MQQGACLRQQQQQQRRLLLAAVAAAGRGPALAPVTAVCLHCCKETGSWGWVHLLLLRRRRRLLVVLLLLVVVQAGKVLLPAVLQG